MSLLHLHSEKRIFGLDLMRAVAILMVLSSHLLHVTLIENSNGQPILTLQEI